MRGWSAISGYQLRVKERRRLVLVAGITVLCAAVALLIEVEAIRILAGVPLALILPGYGITAAVFEPGVIPRPQRAVLVLASSLAVLALGALILNVTPGGIRTVSWAILLAGVTLIGCAFAWRRPAAPWPVGPTPRLRIRPPEAALLVGAALALGAATVVARSPVPAEHVVGHTQLSMLSVVAGGEPSLRVRAASNEQRSMNYRLVLGQRRAPRRVTEQFELEPGEIYERVLPMSRFNQGEGPRLVTARLYQMGDPDTAYRRVNAWISER